MILLLDSGEVKKLMYEPDNRLLYLDILRPPPGYYFDTGCVTTFSLNLMTLLIAPTAFALFDYVEQEEIKANPLAILEGIRRYSKQLTVFYQKGRISVPSSDSRLYSYLEPMVAAVNKKDGIGVFHPKIWLLRYTNGDTSIRYRLICLSRNLTFDESWDTSLVLEGKLGKRSFARNQPISDFIKELVKVTDEIGKERKRGILGLAREVINVDFEPVHHFKKNVRFLPIGISNYKDDLKIPKCKRILVVSPFLSDSRLKKLSSTAERSILVSKEESLDALDKETRSRFSEIYFLNHDAEQEGILGNDEPETTKAVDAFGQNDEVVQKGLHAKMFIAETDEKASVYTGSANATNMAFTKNIEFVVRLDGLKKDVGISKFFGDEKNGFRSLLLPYTEFKDDEHKEDKEKELEELVEQKRIELACLSLSLRAKKTANKEIYDLNLTNNSKGTVDLSGIDELVCWPISQNKRKALAFPVGNKKTVVFKRLSTATLTSFIGFSVTAKKGRIKRSIDFVMNLPITGLPSNRNESILISIINNKSRFIEMIILLLYEGESFFGNLPLMLSSDTESQRNKKLGALNSISLFEELLKALSRNPDKLKQIEQLVVDIKKSKNAENILPEDFDELWETIRVASNQVKR